ncbi:MAG: DEAD/DEAH box helicase [Desulfotomaculum sp.]|nr:DEAD/DEAH box helicase [Desulfotomaculum sp.]
MTSFNELGFDKKIVRAVDAMGFKEPTPIQEKTIPLALQGKDLIGRAQTGTGKTAAYGIPLIEKLTKDRGQVKGLVLAPVRELAVQIAAELNKIGKYKGIRALPVYGGQSINLQIKALKQKPQIIVATPGRLIDHMRRKTIRISSLEVVVLDEADEMLNMGFIDDIETILQEVPKDRQMLLFSATMPKMVQTLANKFMNEPKLVSVKSKEMTVSSIEQYYIQVPEEQKLNALCRLLDTHVPELAIVFGQTKRRVDQLNEALNNLGYASEAIHGDLNQRKRGIVLNKFKEGKIRVLVATDVAARGLDISGVTHVYNFDIPQQLENYIHRVGRTGRAGSDGLAVTFFTPREMGCLKAIERITRRKIKRKSIPTEKEVLERQKRIVLNKLLTAVEQEQYHNYISLAEELLKKHPPVTLISAALKVLAKEEETFINFPKELLIETKRKKRSSKRRETG